MRWLWLVPVLLGAGPGAAARDTLTLTPKLSLAHVLRRLDAFTPAVIRVAPADGQAAEQYLLPPSLDGHVLRLKPVRTALDFLCGKGWEGSPLPVALRTDPRFMLARCPFRPQWNPRLWVCNNIGWSWRWEKKPGDPPGGVIHVQRAVQPDGDVVPTTPFRLEGVREEFALNELLQMVKHKTNIVVNIVGNQYAATPLPGKKQPQLEPFRVRELPADLRARLQEPQTLGDVLTVLAYGLTLHTRREGGLWKWSSSVQTAADGTRETAYTLRDYGRR